MRPLRFNRARFRCTVLFFLLAGAGLVNAQTGGASITLQPVPPKTVPLSNYPPGTTIVGQEIILGSVPARVWLEIRITGWAPETLKTAQVKISATDPEQDGGGYSGANAMCLGSPAIGAGNLQFAMQSCNVNADCRPMMSGFQSACGVGEPSRCAVWDGVSPGGYFPPGRWCEPWFQDMCDPQWIATGIAATPAIDVGGYNPIYGFSADPGEVPPDFAPSYLGTLVLDVPANAKGTYTIDFKEDETFLQNPNNPPNNNIPVSLFAAKITVPCGRCCSGYVAGQIECVDHVGAVDCTDPNDQVFTDGEACPAGGGPDCAECASNVSCDDGIVCTKNLCSADHECTFMPNDAICDDGVFCNGQEICGAASGCGPGQPPCDSSQCDEDADACRPGIPTVSNWGLVILILAVLIVAKLRYRRLPVQSSF